jgi:DNA-binding LytR/AlgR family response regulator
MIKTILIDDNSNDLEYLKKLCLSISVLQIEKTFTCAVKAFEWLSNNKVDLIISDIEMPLINGIDMIKQLKHKPLIILVSAHPNYALSSFEIEPIHYLVKPIKMEHLLVGIERVKNRLNNKEPQQDYIFILKNKEYLKINHSDILYIQAEGNFVKVVTKTDSFLTLSNLTQFTKQLPNSIFLRVHKTYTVNVKNVQKYTSEHLSIHNQIIPLGTSYKIKVLAFFKKASIQRKV